VPLFARNAAVALAGPSSASMFTDSWKVVTVWARLSKAELWPLFVRNETAARERALEFVE